jgi:hypothetical protein
MNTLAFSIIFAATVAACAVYRPFRRFTGVLVIIGLLAMAVIVLNSVSSKQGVIATKSPMATNFVKPQQVAFDEPNTDTYLKCYKTLNTLLCFWD